MAKDITALIIMDGYGISPKVEHNAVANCGAHYIKDYMEAYPHSLINASEEYVGLPSGQMGNSEVGHLNIGAGRIVYQELTRISKSIVVGDFFENEVLLKAVNSAKENGGAVHLMGLLSDGGVHSHIEHLFALLKLLKQNVVEKVYIHCFMDGRDVPPTSGIGYIKKLQDEIDNIGIGQIATIIGRYYAMDRDNRWERVEKAYKAIADAQGEAFENAYALMEKGYSENITDEFIIPSVLNGYNGVQDKDSIIFFNFRPDRAREITRAFTFKDFDGFERKAFKEVCYVCMTQYDITFDNVLVAYKPQTLANTFGEYISNKGLRQLRIAETEKYAHVTFFFNGGVEKANVNEDRVLIPSPKVATYDLKPEMSALEVKNKILELLDKDIYDCMIINFANPDMVGHTGDYQAACKAVQTVESSVHEVVEKIRAKGGRAIITADHGNAEKMKAEGGPHTAHTTNLVPLIIVDDKLQNIRLLENGKLSDIAPTMLYLMGLEKPKEMTGENLIINK